MLDDIGLLSTLLWHFERFTTQTQVKVNFTHHGLDRNLGSDISTVVYRIVQEALTNVARYAGVNEVDVKIESNRETISLEVQDRGRGFDMAAISARSATGLSGMRERAQLLGGALTIDSKPGSGTRIKAELPIPV
jgi:signal transduction histidine kinase